MHPFDIYSLVVIAEAKKYRQKETTRSCTDLTKQMLNGCQPISLEKRLKHMVQKKNSISSFCFPICTSGNNWRKVKYIEAVHLAYSELRFGKSGRMNQCPC